MPDDPPTVQDLLDRILEYGIVIARGPSKEVADELARLEQWFADTLGEWDVPPMFVARHGVRIPDAVIPSDAELRRAAGVIARMFEIPRREIDRAPFAQLARAMAWPWKP
jgi:hypothetical protein